MTTPVVSSFPQMNTFNQIAPLIIQQYENYLPTAFDDSLSLLQKVNKIIQFLNTTNVTINSDMQTVVDSVNNLITEWNSIIEWVENDGLNQDVINKLDQMSTDGTLKNLINIDILGSLSDLQTTDKTSIVNAINSNTKQLSDIAINVKLQYGLKGDGTTDDSTPIQNAINALPSIGGKLLLPDNTILINSNITFNGKNIVLITGPNTTFIGTGTMPTNITNANHQIRRHYEVTTPNGGAIQKGDATLSTEVAPSSNYIGNAVAGYFGAKTGPMSGSAWAVNAIAKVDSGFSGFVNTVEIDTDCESSTAQRIQGLLISGLGSQNIYSGLTIDRADDSRNEHGIIIDKVLDGVTILNADNTGVLVQNTGLSGVLAENNNIGLEVSQAKTNGIFIHDMDTGHIKLKPLTDTNLDQAMIYGVNSGDSQVNWQVTKGGKGEFTGGLQIGGGTLIKNCISSAPTLTFPSVSANSTVEMTTNVSGVKVVDSVTANPIATIGQGLMWSAYVSANDTVTIRIANVTSGALTPVSVQWIINVLQIF